MGPFFVCELKVFRWKAKQLTATNTLVKSWLLPPAYVVRRQGNVLTRVCPSIHLSVHRGVPQPGLDGGGGYPGQVQTEGGTPTRSRWSKVGYLLAGMGYPWPGQDGGILKVGYPLAGMGYPLAGMGYPPDQVRMWGVPKVGYLLAGMGYPPVWTTGVLATRRAVCLLRSRRRTFLFVK